MFSNIGLKSPLPTIDSSIIKEIFELHIIGYMKECLIVYVCWFSCVFVALVVVVALIISLVDIKKVNKGVQLSLSKIGMDNFVEMKPLWQQKRLREFCEEKRILITAYSPLGGKGTPWGTNRVMECDVLKEIADAKGKTIAQVCLRWAYEQGVSFVMKSFNKTRIEENLDIFEWKLSPEELQKINQIPQPRGNPALEFIADNGPYKSVIELWDGEI
ncbi:non-functional NADPH-dependent codeinone reductase 2 [Fagus crenata]